MVKRTLLALGLVVGSAIALIGATKIKAERHPKFDFSTLHSWSWRTSGPGDVKVWLTADSKPEVVQRTYEPVIVQAVEDELTRRKFTKATGAPPDFVVTYYMLITAASSTQQMGQFLPAITEWGVPPFTAQTTATRVYPLGSLVLDIASPADRVVWRAVAQAEVELGRTEAQRTASLKRIIKDIVAKLPRK
jgi:hypothetical protein